MAQFEEVIIGQIRYSGITRVIGGVTMKVYGVDASGNINEAVGAVLPVATSAGFAEGGWFTLTGGGVVTKTYENRGSATSCNFIAVDAIGPASIALTTGNTLVGVAGVATDSNTLTITTPALTVNTINLTGAATGSPVIIKGIGTDANVSVIADGKGTGTFGINTASTTAGLVTIGNSTSLAGAAINGATSVTSASASALAVGLAGATNPALKIDASTALSATGVQVKSAAAAGGVAVQVISSGTNESATVDAKGTGTLGLNTTATNSGVVLIGNGTAKGGASIQGGVTINDATTGALAVGANGTTNPALRVDASTALSATGIQIKSAAAAGGVAISTISSGANETLVLSGKGTGGAALVGTSTNDSATAGQVGELVSSVVATGAAVSLTTATVANVTSISLTAGDWELDGSIDYNLGAATTTDWAAGISTTTAALGGQDTYTSQPLVLTTHTDTYNLLVPNQRLSLAATTTVYLVARSTFSAGTVAGFGTIRARRVR